MKQWQINLVAYGFLVSVIALVAALVFFHALGKYELCKNYYPEMNRVACFLFRFPAVVHK